MNITRGLQPAISQFNNLEQKLISKVAEKLKENGFPLDLITSVHLQKNIHTIKEYYADNEITFVINPGVYKESAFNWGIENIGVGWEDPSVIYTPDGGMEFEVGKKTDPEDLIMSLYRLNDSYSYGKILKNHQNILAEINAVLLSNDVDDMGYLASKSLSELMEHYHIVITEDAKSKNIYTMKIKTIEYIKLVLDEHYNEPITQYDLKIDLNKKTIQVTDFFYPTLYPTPANLPTPFNEDKS